MEQMQICSYLSPSPLKSMLWTYATGREGQVSAQQHWSFHYGSARYLSQTIMHTIVDTAVSSRHIF